MLPLHSLEAFSAEKTGVVYQALDAGHEACVVGVARAARCDEKSSERLVWSGSERGNTERV